MAREPGTSFPSETRQMTRQDRLKADGGGPPGLLVLIVAVVVIAAVTYVVVRYR